MISCRGVAKKRRRQYRAPDRSNVREVLRRRNNRGADATMYYGSLWRSRGAMISRRDAPELCNLTLSLRKQRAQGKPGARCTRGLACKMCTRTRTRAYRFSGEHPAFPAQWFYGLWRALPGDRLSCRRHSADISAKLDASIGASEPHDFAVRISHVRQSQLPRPPHPTARFVTIASRPSCRVRRAELCP